MLVILIAIFFTMIDVYCQSSRHNYVLSAQMCERFRDTPSLTYDMARITIDYYDGLGRPVQNVRVGASGSAFDLHTLTEYDQYGRAYRSWLPIEASSAGNYLDSEAIKNTAKVLYSDNRPFTESIAERTPELLDSEVYGVGELWYNADRKKTQKRGINTDDICPRFDVDTEGRLVMNGYYDEGRLRYEEITDENEDFIIYRFYDTEKRLILDTKYNGEDYYDTYYVYNTIGQLTYLIPPKAASELFLADDGVCDTAVVRKLCYHYAYDQYNRLVEKRLPDAEPEYFVYDALDNIVLSQDGNLRRENKWKVQKLDHKYRKSVEGIATLVGETRTSLQERSQWFGCCLCTTQCVWWLFQSHSSTTPS